MEDMFLLLFFFCQGDTLNYKLRALFLYIQARNSGHSPTPSDTGTGGISFHNVLLHLYPSVSAPRRHLLGSVSGGRKLRRGVASLNCAIGKR